ncbi:hypothetical protein YC2023_080666 [Brassica napus]
MLVSTTENTRKCLRREISEIVFTVSNGRDVLRHGSSRENWWNGGVLKGLFNIFFKTYGDDGNQGCVRIAARRLVEALEVRSIRVNVASRKLTGYPIPTYGGPPYSPVPTRCFNPPYCRP